MPRLSSFPRTVALAAMMCLLILAGCASSVATTPPPTDPGRTPCTSHSATPVTLSMYYGSEKENWINDVVPTFNRQHYVACDGPITVNAIPIGSGDSMEQILDGKIQPDIWSPAGSAWITILNDKWSSTHGGTPIVGSGAEDAVRLVTSPVVIAMWRDEAQALGWPQKAIGWSDIVKLSTDPRGWADYGHPEWGLFKFGHTRPNLSNSGLDAIIAEAYAAVGKVRDLTQSDITRASTRDFIASAETSVIHYGDSTGFFANEMFNNGPTYLSADVMYESLVTEAYNPQLYPKVGTQFPQVVAIYPKEGTFYSDHPFVIPQASWVSPAQKAAAEVFRDYLLQPAQQQKALYYGFRSVLPSVTGAPIDAAHGVDPSQPMTVLPVPAASVIETLLSSWEELRRKVSVMLILDRSGSMNDVNNNVTKISGAKQGLTEFAGLLSDGDSMGLTVFSDSANVLTPVSPLGPKRHQVLNAINAITAQGSTRLYDTIAEQEASLTALPSTNIKALVVLTDGMDNVSTLTLDQLVSKVSPTGVNAGDGVKIFTIAYGTDADTTALTNIANAAGGQEYAGNTENIVQVYDTISQFF
jgi:Ca-activated chloride channel family protein